MFINRRLAHPIQGNWLTTKTPGAPASSVYLILKMALLFFLAEKQKTTRKGRSSPLYIKSLSALCFAYRLRVANQTLRVLKTLRVLRRS